MKKQLPSPKKTLKSFILEEDAKVIDKTATKVALTASFLALNFTFAIDDANAKGHYDHANHSNFLEHKGTDAGLSNEGNTTVTRTFTENVEGQPVSTTVDIPEKSVASAHANHYNHQNGGGKK